MAVADAFELAVELGGRVIRVAVFFFLGGFGLALLEGVVQVGLGDGLEGEQGEGEGRRGGVEAAMVRIDGFFSAVSEALKEENGGEEREKGEESPLMMRSKSMDAPVRMVNRRRGWARHSRLRRCF